MKFKDFNIMIRELCNQLISEGYNKQAIGAVTLGTTSMPLFERLLEGKDIGNKPLERLLNSFGYELMIQAVKDKDQKIKASIEQSNLDFLRNIKTDLKNYLDNRVVNKRGCKKNVEVHNQIDDIICDVIDKLDI